MHSAVARTLGRLREAFHRRARLADPNEALDELAKLLFAHGASQAHGLPAISTSTFQTGDLKKTAKLLRQFVSERIHRFLPDGLIRELTAKDFELKLRDSEYLLAAEIIEAFDDLDLGDRDHAQFDPINEAFGRYLTDSFVNQREMGQYLTPPEVTRFMVSLAIEELTAEERSLLCDSLRCGDFGVVLDPSCGVGSFLLQFLRHLKPLVASQQGDQIAMEWANAMLDDVMVGIDKSERMLRFALLNTAINGTPARGLHLANALSLRGKETALTDRYRGKAGLILTNPPFGAEFSGDDLNGYELTETLRLKKAGAELLFFERYLEWLRPGGQLVAIVPDSILTNKGVYHRLRRYLASRVDIKSVISLPAATFAAAGTTTKTSVLHLRKRDGAGARHNKTFFGICNDIGYGVVTRNSQRVKVQHSDGELPHLLQALREARTSGTGLRAFDPAREMRWDAAMHTRHNGAERDTQIVRLSDVAEIIVEKQNPATCGTRVIGYIEIADVEPTTLTLRAKPVEAKKAPSRARRQVRAGDVLVSTVRPERRSIGVVSRLQDGFFCTTGFAVVRPTAIHPIALALLLKSDAVTRQLTGTKSGIAYPVFEAEALRDVHLPVTREGVAKLDEAAVAIAEAQDRWALQWRSAHAILAEVMQDDGSAVS